jgi:hypothetical protein
MTSRRSTALRTIAKEVVTMLSHPDAFIDLAMIRHQELQAECARYRLSAQAAPARGADAQLAGARARLSGLASRLRSQLRALRDPEKLLEAFSRIDYPIPM